MSREVEEIKQRLDIVETVQQYVPLKRAGANHKGNCPFHQEKSPSFMVSQGKQIWHCFGCHEGGDIFSFVQKIEGLNFYETLKLLGERAGVKIEKRVSPQEVQKKDALREVLETTRAFYHKILTSHPQAAEARAYTSSRGLRPETLSAFNIGFAPDAWDVLQKFLSSRGFSNEDMVAAGVMVYNQDRRSYYDRFRGRLMIPLCDVNGRVVGFTARAIAKEFEGGKYINTPQTELYDKSRVVFALDQAKQAIKAAGHVVVVEGNMDAISSHQAGVKQVVAVSGTAFTEAQIALLKRFTNTLIFSFDADAAGFMAARRGMELALRAGMGVKALTLPYGKDPDECIQKDPALWEQSIASARPVMDVILSRSLATHDPRLPDGKKQIAQDVLSMLKHFTNPVEVEHYVRLLGDELQTSHEALYQVLRQQPVQAARSRSQPQSGAKAMPEPQKPAAAPSPEQSASQDILALYAMHPGFLDGYALEDFLILPGSEEQALYKEMKSFYDMAISAGENPLFTEAFSKRLAHDLQTFFSRLQLYGDKEFAELTGPEATQVLGARLSFLKRKRLEDQLRSLQADIRDAERAQDMARLQQLSRDFSVLSQQLAQIN